MLFEEYILTAALYKIIPLFIPSSC